MCIKCIKIECVSSGDVKKIWSFVSTDNSSLERSELVKCVTFQEDLYACKIRCCILRNSKVSTSVAVHYEVISCATMCPTFQLQDMYLYIYFVFYGYINVIHLIKYH